MPRRQNTKAVRIRRLKKADFEVDFFFIDRAELFPSAVNPRWSRNPRRDGMSVSTLLLQFRSNGTGVGSSSTLNYQMLRSFPLALTGRLHFCRRDYLRSICPYRKLLMPEYFAARNPLPRCESIRQRGLAGARRPMRRYEEFADCCVRKHVRLVCSSSTNFSALQVISSRAVCFSGTRE